MTEGQYPMQERMHDPEYSQRWLMGEFIYMTWQEQEQFLLAYGTRKQRKAIKAARKERGQAQKQSGGKDCS